MSAPDGSTHLPNGKPLPALPAPEATEGLAAPFMNFAGPGYRSNFRIRPQNLFDFAAKIHDMTYHINNLSFSESYENQPQKRSQRAKADKIFHIMNDAVKIKIISSLYRGIAKAIFEDEDKIIAEDGFINVLKQPEYIIKLSKPSEYLMIPFESLPTNQRRYTITEQMGKYVTHKIKKPDYQTAVDYDFKPGFLSWASSIYGVVLSSVKQI
ncbi:hypothetical protein FMN63_11385 [Stappia sp. BW2]|uniref:hypothetical protein n=1 Tax=Stappia sp. BW2 TaxID=2592622 RepID=UPI0011DE7B2E|nr:hypothetical protein [Stappia sp. BW2]TYC68278.1 hypothetical protein FMN63_11385 [Stappia sp. BW2]